MLEVIVCNNCQNENNNQQTWCQKCQSLIRISDYLIDFHIGSGAMGDVYCAKKNNQNFAIKILKERSHRFFQEVRLGKKAKNSGANQLLHSIEDFEWEGKFVLVQNYIDGENLKIILQKEDEILLPISRKLKICISLVNALLELQSLNIIHRDIKPENLIIKGNDEVVILDFGMAKDDLSYQITQPGEIVGTYYYMAPEAIDKGSSELNKSADIYSIGMVIYEIFHGRIPYDFSEIDKNLAPGNLILKIMMIKEAFSINPHILNFPGFPGVPSQMKEIFKELIKLCLHYDPDKRCDALYLNEQLDICKRIYDSHILEYINKVDTYSIDFLKKIPYTDNFFIKGYSQTELAFLDYYTTNV